MNFRIARKVLKNMFDELRQENWGAMHKHGPTYTAQQVSRATYRCMRQQKHAIKLKANPDCTRVFRSIPLPGYA